MAIIQFKSKLSSAVVNNTFANKTQDDETIGKYGLKETASGDSGDIIENAQLQINQNRQEIQDELTLVNGSQITLVDKIGSYHLRVGASAPITVDNLPFNGSQVVGDATAIRIIGTDDTNSVSFTHNDVDYGLLLFGNCELKKGYILNLIYDNNLKRYIEESRNF